MVHRIVFIGLKVLSIHDTCTDWLLDSECMLTPEHSTEIQNVIGADIMMQLDDVVHSTTTGPRVEEAMHRYMFILGISNW